MAFLVLTGALFLAVGLVGTPFLAVDASRKPAVAILAAILIAVAFLFFVAWRRGRLEKQGKSLLEVRLRAVGKVKERSTLLKIAEDVDEHPDVRALAAEHLKEIGEA